MIGSMILFSQFFHVLYFDILTNKSFFFFDKDFLNFHRFVQILPRRISRQWYAESPVIENPYK